MPEATRALRAARAVVRVALLMVLAAAVHGSRCDAQTTPPDSLLAPTAFSVTSQPPGALVVLQGEHTVRGRAPFTVARGLSGRYDVSAYAPGYEEWRSTLYLDPGANRTLSIQMSQKLRWKGIARSVLFPGWGQRYSGQKTKSVIFGALEIGALAWVGIEHFQYQDRVDALRDAEHAYENEKNEAEIRRLYGVMERERSKAEDQYDQRRLAVYAAGAVWAVNILDAVLFYPSSSEGFYSQVGSGGELMAGFRMEF
jgi:hypothetical protein